MTDAEIILQLNNFKLNIKDAAEKLINVLIPKKIETLNNLITSFKNNDDLAILSKHDIIHVPEPRRKRVLFERVPGTSGFKLMVGGNPGPSGSKVNFRNGTLISLVEHTKSTLTNVRVKNLLLKVKPNILELLQDTNTLKMWMTFIMPKFNNGNNINETIRQTVMYQIESIEEYAMCVFENTSLYFLSRADNVAQVSMFPHIEDYRSAVKECDEDSYRCMCKRISQIRDCYCLLYDAICKNFDRLTEPFEPNMSI